MAHETQNVLRVNYDDLEADPEWIWESFYYFNGKPFTGVAYETFPDGQLWSEVEYVDGRAEGKCREWYLSGDLKYEGYDGASKRYTWYFEWFEDGTRKEEKVLEWHKLIKHNIWNESGELISSYESPEEPEI